MKGIRKKTAGLLALIVTLSSVPVLPVSAEDSEIALRIARVELSPEQVATLSPYGGFEERIQRTREEIAGIRAEIDGGNLPDEEREKKRKRHPAKGIRHQRMGRGNASP